MSVPSRLHHALTQVDRILDHDGKRGKIDYLVKWKGLEYSKSTWEDERELVGDEDKIRAYKVGWSVHRATS